MMSDRTPDDMSALMIKLSRLNADDKNAREAISQAAHGWLALSPEFNRTYVHIHRLSVPKDRQGEGFGTAIMQALCTIADERGWVLTVTPDRITGTTSVDRLKRFYKRFGFRVNAGRRRDFDTQANMIRDK